MSILIKRKDGTVDEMKNAEYLTAFYAIPYEILAKACPDLLEISRHPAVATRDWKQIELIESDHFKEAIIDIYAYLAWEHLDISPYMEIYSGYDPLWKIAHVPVYWIQTMIDEKIWTEINNNICIFMENCLDTFTFWNLVKCFMFFFFRDILPYLVIYIMFFIYKLKYYQRSSF